MNQHDIEKYVMKYIEATQCHIVEKTPTSVTTRLSPEADQDLTNRPYYWSFVERTGTPPQTMTLQMIFDAASHQPELTPATERIPRDEVTYGSARLQQLFRLMLKRGRFVQMYEELQPQLRRNSAVASLHPWLAINYKVEFCCDMKRDELYQMGISLLTGQLIEDFPTRFAHLNWTPRLPTNTYIQRPVWSLHRAIAAVEEALENDIRQYDHSWATSAQERLEEELALIETYYRELLQSSTLEPEQREAVEKQYTARKQEIEWQYRPRIVAHVVNVGMFYLHIDSHLQKF